MSKLCMTLVPRGKEVVKIGDDIIIYANEKQNTKSKSHIKIVIEAPKDVQIKRGKYDQICNSGDS